MDLGACGLLIKKEPGGLYSAAAYKFSPSLDWVKPQWSTSMPTSKDELIQELLALGFHQTDIGDAFYAADPDWRRRSLSSHEFFLRGVLMFSRIVNPISAALPPAKS